MKLDFDLAKPIYQQIIDEIKRAVARGDLKPGDKIPSQREMAEEAKVNPNTVQRAYQEMERLQLTETIRGQGTFIRQETGLISSIRLEMAAEALQKFLEEMRSLGYEEEEIKNAVSSAFGKKR